MGDCGGVLSVEERRINMTSDFYAFAQTLLVVLLTPLVAFAIDYLRRRVGLEKIQQLKGELETKQAWSLLAVRYADQVYWEAAGKARYDAACKWLSEHATEKGMPLTQEEIQGLIESSVRLIRTELTGLWNTPIV